MAPQPVGKNVRGLVYHGNVISQRPELALKAMHVIALWAHAEYNLNSLLALLLKSEIEKATLMLQTIESASIRRAVIMRLSQESLSKDDYLLLCAILTTTRASERRRNMFAHYIWGIAEEFPDAIVLADPKDLNMQAAIMHGSNLAKLKELTEKPLFGLIFKAADLENDVKDAARAANVISRFYGMLWMDRFPLGGELADQVRAIRETLSTEPLIAQELQRLREKSSPEPQTQFP